MNDRKMVTRVAPVLIAGVMAAFAWPATRADAQQALPSPTSVGPVVKGGSGIGAPQPSAPGLPGARPSAVINKGSISADLMSPNDELFDAIDRGDVTAARDAIARGAELNATNAVGQTPIDASVALGRNSITFLLVTLLHASGSQITDAQGPMNMPPPNTLGLSSKDVKSAAAPVSFFSGPAPGSAPASAGASGAGHHRRQYASAGSSADAAQAPASPDAYATTGSPVPSAGFVGFGSSGQ